MKEGLIKDAYELIIKEIQAVISISYVVAVGIGMMFSYKKYSEFDIDIFDYGDIFDFLMTPFSEIYVLTFSLLSIFFVFILFKLDSIWKRKWPRSYSFLNFGMDKRSWFGLYRNGMFLISAMLYLYLSATIYGKYAKEKVLNQKEITVRLVDNEVKTGKLIGKTNNVIFLLKKEDVYAIPISSLVKEIKIR
ncbi:hypothetical protein [Winogradskyella sp.]|uniref:hypothetical protein n=1 Tax=Winogradskyella sp. TaxID=1883156 RepID=UPI00261866D0|nr:hypothetical protein [Winogradskyella sp.]